MMLAQFNLTKTDKPIVHSPWRKSPLHTVRSMLLRSVMSSWLLATPSRLCRARAISAYVSVASCVARRGQAATTFGSFFSRDAAHSERSTATDHANSARVTRDLQPQPLWHFFEEVSSIPRASKHESAVLAYVKHFAEERGLEWREDAAGNMVVRRGGMNGGEAAATVVIQGHVDMVTEKNAASSHNFLRDPIKLIIDGEWLTADGTTLGADNGIGVAAALALLDMPPSSGKALPPLECLFTVEEEIGLIGAHSLDASMFKGRTMLNLDTVEWGSLFVGCAGGGESVIKLPLQRETVDVSSFRAHRIAVEGLMGGHSGINIHEDRANAIKLLVRVLDALFDEVPTIRLAELSGGDKHNAIPREAFATVLLPEEDPSLLAAAKTTLERVLRDLRLEYGIKEAALAVPLADVGQASESCICRDSERRLLSLLSLLPHGVLKMSHDLEGLVETSSNLASVAPTDDGDSSTGEVTYEILCSTRSSLGPALESVRREIKVAAELSGASAVAQKPAYPGWKPDMGSNALKVAQSSLRNLLGGEEPVITALHAGLECGVIGDKAPGMDMVSFGPTIEGAHSPDEKVEIRSVGKFWELVLATLEGLTTSDQR